MFENFLGKSKSSFTDSYKLSPSLRKNIIYAAERLEKNEYSDPNQKVKDLELIRDASQMAVVSETYSGKSTLPNTGNSFNVGGYQPAGSVLRKIMPNDFARHAFLAECYWAARKSRWELWTESYRDSYTLVTPAGMSKREVKLINRVLKDLNIDYLRNKLRDTVSYLGNACVRNEYNGVGGLKKINIMLMPALTPLLDQTQTEIIGWREVNGGKLTDWDAKAIDHIWTYNARSNILGALTLGSLETDIEAALHASIYMNNLMRKGGLLNAVFLMRELKLEDANESTEMTLASEMTKWMQRTFGGVNNAGGVAFLPMVEKVEVLNKPGELDAPWSNLEDRTSIKTCEQFGLFPGRIGIAVKSQYENIQQVTDGQSTSLDNANYYNNSLIDEYLTDLIIYKGLGYDNVQIKATGDFTSITKTAAEAGLLISQNGVDTMTVDEWRQKIAHLPPLGGTLGAAFLGEVTRKAVMAKATAKSSTAKAESDITRAVGSAKHGITEYREAIAEKIIHRASEIQYY